MQSVADLLKVSFCFGVCKGMEKHACLHGREWVDVFYRIVLL